MKATPSRRAVHQFHGGSSVGDAITNGLFFVRGLLRELGYESEIYCADVAPELVGQILPAPTFPDDPDCLLLVHFSWRISYDDWLLSRQCRKALIYHNITPEEYFEAPDFVGNARQSRRQLRALLPSMAGAIAQSAYSARELHELGFHRPKVMPLLFDPGDLVASPVDEECFRSLCNDPAFKVLFVGRIVENKRQDHLLRVIDRLRKMMSRPVKLIMPGGLGAGIGYRNELQRLLDDLSLHDVVDLPGKVSDAAVAAFYRASDVFLCLSEHEGFGVPIAEAMACGLPVVALDGTAVGETCGPGGILVESDDPTRIASLLKVLAEEPEVRRRMAIAGRVRLDAFDRRRTRVALADFIAASTGTPVATGNKSHAIPPATPPWRLEGPFDSSYSLALVNRCLAQALQAQGQQVVLHSAEGHGDFPPSVSFLENRPDVAALWEKGRSGPPPALVMRNMFPPRVTGMSAPTRVLASWGWEESALPWEWVCEFNANLHLITTVSRYVAKVLRDNGVRVPIAVVGNGVDHLQNASPEAISPEVGGKSFRFLHVSSGFPRKGIDALLAAWAIAFTAADDSELVLKTFPNEHNEVLQQVKCFRERYPDAAPLVVIDRDLPAGAMRSLLETSNVLVSPSRGEGFGLPVAEAMLLGIPVIATAHGGLLETCTPDSAWLIDYALTPARTHLRLPHSAWADPDVMDLARAMQEVRSADKGALERKTGKARDAIRALFSWSAVASRTREAIAHIDKACAPARIPRVAWVTSWNARCGIASYARNLACAVPASRLVVLASRAKEPLGDDEPNVERCWTEGWDDSLDELYEAVRRFGVDKVVIQFNFGFYSLRSLGSLLERLRADSVDCFLVMHSTADVDKPGIRISLREIAEPLAKVHRVLVHSFKDLNRLKHLGVTENVTLLPHGFPEGSGGSEPYTQRRAFGLPTGTLFATFGYLLPDKGLPELIEAIGELRRVSADVHLLMMNSLYPGPESQKLADRCLSSIQRLGLQRNVTLVTDHLPDQAVLAYLSVADFVVYPYQRSQESASGAIRFGLASGRPVICTPLAVFDDVREAVTFAGGTTPADLYKALHDAMRRPDQLRARQGAQTRLQESCDWNRLSERLWNMLRAEPVLDLVDRDRSRILQRC